jgi:ABC-type transporter Mla maintaining outer membrane lipid asymmetry ATPase subunit MlaF
MKSAYAISDRIGMLYEGKLVEVGTPKEFQETRNPIVRAFVEGEPGLKHDAEDPLPMGGEGAAGKGRKR